MRTTFYPSLGLSFRFITLYFFSGEASIAFDFFSTSSVAFMPFSRHLILQLEIPNFSLVFTLNLSLAANFNGNESCRRRIGHGRLLSLGVSNWRLSSSLRRGVIVGRTLAPVTQWLHHWSPILLGTYHCLLWLTVPNSSGCATRECAQRHFQLLGAFP